MSILLDALKKSETQRQLGKTPTIHTAVEAPDAARATEQQWIPLSMLALSAVAIAWFGWQQFREPEADGCFVVEFEKRSGRFDHPPCQQSRRGRGAEGKIEPVIQFIRGRKRTCCRHGSRIISDDHRKDFTRSGHRPVACRGRSTGCDSEQALLPPATTQIRADQFLANTPGLAGWFAGIQDQRAGLRGKTGRPFLVDQWPETGGKG